MKRGLMLIIVVILCIPVGRSTPIMATDRHTGLVVDARGTQAPPAATPFW